MHHVFQECTNWLKKPNRGMNTAKAWTQPKYELRQCMNTVNIEWTNEQTIFYKTMNSGSVEMSNHLILPRVFRSLSVKLPRILLLNVKINMKYYRRIKYRDHKYFWNNEVKTHGLILIWNDRCRIGVFLKHFCEKILYVFFFRSLQKLQTNLSILNVIIIFTLKWAYLFFLPQKPH